MNKAPGSKDKKKQKQKAVSRVAQEIRDVVSDVLAERQADPDLEFPAFSLQYLSNYAAVGYEAKQALLDTIRTLSQIRWKEIYTISRHKLGFETLKRRDLNFPIPVEIGSDVTFMAFRFHGLKPMIGFRRGSVFFIVWLDLDFSAYSHS